MPALAQVLSPVSVSTPSQVPALALELVFVLLSLLVLVFVLEVVLVLSPVSALV